MSRPAIYRGIAELQSKGGEKFWAEPGRIRRAGGGRKPLAVADPKIVPTIWTFFCSRWASRPQLNVYNENKILVAACIIE
jgi:hypothetical protein